MRIVYLRSGIVKPFSFIDQMIIYACKKLGHKVIILSPGEEFENNWKRVRDRMRPQVILAMHGGRLTPNNRILLKTISLPKAIWLTDDPYAIDEAKQVAGFFDYVFTNESEAISVYRNKCSSSIVHHLPLAAPILLYRPRKKIPTRYISDLVMVGCGFENRLKFINEANITLSRARTRLVGPGWMKLARKSGLRIRPYWVSESEANYYYSGAKIVLNLHRSHNDPYLKQNSQQILAHTPNNRLFEIAACRSFQLIDHRPDLASLYKIGKEIISFSGIEDFKEKVKFYLPRKQLRERIAYAAYQRTRKEHCYEHRLQTLLSLCSV